MHYLTKTLLGLLISLLGFEASAQAVLWESEGKSGELLPYLYRKIRDLEAACR